MKHERMWVGLGMVLLALAACSGDEEHGPGADSSGAGPNGSGGSAAATQPTGPTGSAAQSGSPPGTCVRGVAATSQIPRLLNRQYEAVVRDLLGVTTIGADNKTASQLLVADSDGPMTPDAWRIYQDVAGQIAHSVMSGPSKSKFIGCDPAAAGCLDRTIRTFGRRAFRRPLTDAEVARFQKLTRTMPAGTPGEVAETTLQAFLVSPSFLLLPELSTTPARGSMGFQLSSHEVATRLSFLLWGSLPDEALDAAADANQLQTKAQILAQAQRMIAVRDKTGPLVAAFHRDWVQMNNGNAHWWKIDHDPNKFPLFSPDAKPSWQAELDAFFEDVAFTGGSFEDLLLSNVAFVNKHNAAIYGLDPSKFGDALVKTPLDATQRPGFLTRAGFLSSYADYDSTSPILRGAFISVYMLGVNPGPPIPGATGMRVTGDFKTQRAYVEALTKPSPCSGCHRDIINPPGFVMESYDALGKLQTTDPRGGSIDSSVTTGTVMFGGGTAKQISSAAELMRGIAESPDARKLYAQAWVAYAFGRDPNGSDQCVVDQLDGKLAQSGYSILGLLADLTQADSFHVRVRQAP